MTKFDIIKKKFTDIHSQVTIDGSLKLYDINIRAEYIFMPILNDTYNYQLINANKIKANFPCIDLIDTNKKIIIQVTSSLSTTKIIGTLECLKKYKNNELKEYVDYKLIFLYIVNSKGKLTSSFLKKNNLKYDNFLDISDLLKKIEDDINLQSKLHETVQKIFTLENIEEIAQSTKPLYQNNKLWKIIEENSNKTIQDKIELLLKNTITLLDSYPFKSIENMEMLLGDKKEKLSLIEAITLLISVYWYKLPFKNDMDIDYYLYNTDLVLDDNSRTMIIQGDDIIDICSKIILSQDYQVEKLYKFKELNSNDNEDDFLFCSILLKLSNLLNLKDFHEEIIFNYKENILYFKSNPNNPNNEYEIKKHLNILESKIKDYNYLFNDLCHKWRDDFKLPSKIDMSNIKSSSYKFGDYKFSFDNNQVLTLLTGRDIYSDPIIFLRELLQNAIDASLYREAVEKSKGNSFQCKPIGVNDWYDDDGNYWIGFDDYGIGMDENILLNYFTKIGKSFYESKDFDSSIGFTAISRFGIGILSCFMVANRVEVSTKKENEKAIRFSINSLHSYFFTQIESEHKVVDKFPSKENKPHKYRQEIGTSIAIQIDFNKINRWFDIKKELLRHIFYSPVEIQYSNEKIGTSVDDLKTNPWINEEISFELNNSDDSTIKELFDLDDMKEKFKIKITPVNLSNYSPTPKIKAQMVLVEVITPLPQIEDGYKRYFEIDKESFVGGLMKIKAEKVSNDTRVSTSQQYDLSMYPQFKKFTSSNLVSKIGHNGIFIGKDFTSSFNSKLLNFTHNDIFALVNISLYDEHRPSMSISRSENISFDYHTLSASNLILSRFITQNGFTNKAFDCSLIYDRFNSNFSIKEIINDPYIDEWKKEKIFLTTDKIYISLNEIQELLHNSQVVQVLNYPQMGYMSVDYIGKEHSRGMFIEILTQLFTDGFINETGKFTITKVFDTFKAQDNLIYFPIGFFTNYDEASNDTLQLKYLHNYYALNYEHEFSKWLINNSKLLNDKYKGVFEDIKNFFNNSFRRDNDFEKLLPLLELVQQLAPDIVDDKLIDTKEISKWYKKNRQKE